VVLVKFPGIADRDAADALRGLRLYLSREALPAPEDEEYYHADLIGLDAMLGDGTRIGRVHAVHDFGAGDCLEVVRPAGPPAVVPFTRAVVPVVDIAGGRVVLDPPPGLLEDPHHPAKPRGPRTGAGRERAMTWHATVLTISRKCCRAPRPFACRKALNAGLWHLETVDIRNFARDKHRSVDDAPFGAGREW